MAKKIKFEVQNMVASANLQVELDLYAIAREVENVEYEPEQFPGAILKLDDPKTSLLLFKIGKVICAGAKSEADVDKAIRKAYSKIKDCVRGERKKPNLSFVIVNIVASAHLDVDLDLYAIAKEVENVEYEPEQFPGAILKLKDPKTSLLLFKNGKLICTGAKNEADVGRSINKTYEMIKKYVRETK